MKSKTHLLFIDGLRALAALFVVAHHSLLQFDNISHPLPRFETLTLLPFYFGHFAVDLFIVLSGFCLMLPVTGSDYQLKGGIGYFFKRRVIRILPPYYLAILISIILIETCVGDKTGTHWDASIPITFNDIYAHIFLIHDLFKSTSPKINHSLWSVSVECRIYLFFPILLFIWRQYGLLKLIIASLLGCALTFILLNNFAKTHPDFDIASAGVIPYILLFLLGMIAADLSTKTDGLKNKNSWLIMAVVVVAIALGLKSKFYSFAAIGRHFDDLIFGISCFALLMFCLRSPTSLLVRALSNKWLVFIGSFSYSIYLLHAPLVAVLYKYILVPLHLPQYSSEVLFIIFGTVICTAISYVFFIFFEKPFLNMGKKKTIKQTELNAAVNPAI